MSHGRKPRRQRWAPRTDTFAIALNGAVRLTADEVDEVLQPIEEAFTALRQGVATELQWCVLASALNVAIGIEKQGVVRGMAEHLHSAELALQAIQRRAMATSSWKPTALYYQELENVRTAVELHRYQYEQLSRGEAMRAISYAQAEVASTGGCVLRVFNPSLISQPAPPAQ